MKHIFTLFLTLATFSLYSQTFTGTGGPILDDGSDNYYYLTVSGVTPTVMDTNFGLETVCINLTHTWDDDLIIFLIAPDGTEFELSSRNGGDGDNYTNTCFNNDAPTPIYLGSPPFTGVFKPEGYMSSVNNGQNPNGVWILHILDTYAWADFGTLLDWSVTFGNNPASPFPFSSANLPLVVINTQGHSIPDEPKIMANMKIIRNPGGQPNHMNDPPNVYDGWVGIEMRGASSMTIMPKKSFTVETRNADSSNLDVSLLGMPAGNDWVLIGNYADKSLLRNYYTYRLFRKMGHWAPRMEFCELVIDKEYQGIYVLGEKIKRGQDRVDIHSLKPSDTTGTAVTGGYIIKLDWEDPGDVGWFSEFPAVNATGNLKYLFDYPKAENVVQPHINYIKAYVDSFEYAMNSPFYADTINGFRKYIDESSFIDYIILTEYVKNVDGYRLSMFFYKDRNGKLFAGPPWDYDLACGNADYMEAYLPMGWDYTVQTTYTNQCPFWWSKFFQDSLFQNRLKCRWLQLREDVLNPVKVKAEIDSLGGVLSVSTGLNFTKWPILGIYVWPNPAPIPPDYPGEISRLKDWADLRTVWLDNHWTGMCSIVTAITDLNEPSGDLSLFPNPSDGIITVNIKGTQFDGRIEIQDITGKIVYSSSINDNKLQLSLNASPGLYFVRFISNKNVLTKRLIIEK